MHNDEQSLIDALLDTTGVVGLRVAADGVILDIYNEPQLREWLPASQSAPGLGHVLDAVLEPMFSSNDLSRIRQAIEALRTQADAPPELLYELISPTRRRGAPPRSFDLWLRALPGDTSGAWLLSITETTARRTLMLALEQARDAHGLALTVLSAEPGALRTLLRRATTDIASFRARLRQPARSESALREKISRLLALTDSLRQAAEALPMPALTTPLSHLGSQLTKLHEAESLSGDDLLPLAMTLDNAATVVTTALTLDEQRHAALAGTSARAFAQPAPWYEICEQHCADLVRRTAKRRDVLATLRIRGIALVPESCHRLVEMTLPSLLHNAVHHGIEAPSARIVAGKPATGKISVTFIDHGAQGIEMRVHDDGRGFDLERIRTAAERSGLGTCDELTAMDPQRLVSQVFRRRFSTQGLNERPDEQQSVAQLRQLLLRHGGTIVVSTKPSRYTMFSVRLPAIAATGNTGESHVLSA
ncbi:MAG: hypothetical protein LBE59_00580 [Nevskiaceae bacterium]|jgi:hypothetical protein|nr:hypothetical protein [Nevskiaceae bacterium]